MTESMNVNVLAQRVTDLSAAYLGDNVDVIDGFPDNSIGLSVTSVPFPGMYAYTNSPRDMGNVRDRFELLDHLRYLVSENKLLRVMKPGRTFAVHLTQEVAFKHREGFSGLYDFRGDVIRLMQDAGWIYYGEAVIAKNPQVKAVRTNDHGLQFKSLATDASKMHMALNDTLLQFLKPGDNPDPIRAGINEKYGNPDGWITNDEWIKWACGVWTDIRETNVLNYRSARETDDERHLCPLQLDVIERAIKLWSAPGETVFDPFGGIGSVPVVAVLWRRFGVMAELKESYYKTACKNLEEAEGKAKSATIFSLFDGEEGNI